jgi:hypothetical protein
MNGFIKAAILTYKWNLAFANFFQQGEKKMRIFEEKRNRKKSLVNDKNPLSLKNFECQRMKSKANSFQALFNCGFLT